MGRWSISFRSSDFNGDDKPGHPKRGRRETAGDLAVPVAGEGQHPCPRGFHCASSTRAEDGTWHPLLINSVFCPADEAAIVNAVPGLPESYARLTAQMTDPLRSKASGPGGRRPPGSRVLVDAGDDALLREAAMVLNGWAARVRGVPGIQLSPRQHLPGTQAGVEENCGVLARFATQLLALPAGPVLRTWEYLPGREDVRLAAVPCRRCGTFVTASPSARYWWPAVCAHPLVLPSAWAEDRDGRYPVAWACAECSTPFRGSPPKPRPACAHEPSGTAPPRPAERRQGAAPTQAEVEEKIADLEVVRAGDGWVTVITDLSGTDAGLDVLDLAARFRRLLLESPARPEALDGIACHVCDEYALVRADPPSDPSAKAMHSRCSSCGDVLSREDYDDWVKLSGAFARGGSKPEACRRCALGRCGECRWTGCGCAATGHRAA